MMLWALSTISNPFKEFRSSALARILISNRSRDCQLNLSTGASLTPKFQLGSKSLGAFTDAAQSPMAGNAALLQHIRVDARSVVADANAKDVIAESNLGLDSMRVCMPIGVSQNLKCDPADFVLVDPRQHPLLTFLNQVEDRRLMVVVRVR